MRKRGFTLVEMLIVIAIIGIISSIISISLFVSRAKARVAQIGRFLTQSCYLPDSGEGEYDLIPLVAEIIIKYPQRSKYFSQVPRDPRTGTETESKYIYIVDADGKKCALYANLENSNEPVTLTITNPIPGGGEGVFKTNSPGWNNTDLYYQYSN